MFQKLPMPPPDALHAVMEKYAEDLRVSKMDLGVGVYRDQTGHSPVMRAIKEAEKNLILSEDSKSYGELKGRSDFIQAMKSLVFGTDDSMELASMQTVGGTGGIRLALEIARQANPETRVIIGNPTWPNHHSICKLLNLETKTYVYFDKATQDIKLDNLMGTIDASSSGDILILHGPCHNPSGSDLTREQLLEVVETSNARGITPLFDVAYYGLANPLQSDLDLLREVANRAERLMLVLSCSKAFGLYRERTGVLFMKVDSGTTPTVQRTLESIARAIYSMPPSHGAALVSNVLCDEKLRNLWELELSEMRNRILRSRVELAELGRLDAALSAVSSQKGIFSLLPIEAEDVTWLADACGIYLPQSGRINIAGFKAGAEKRFCEALSNRPSLRGHG